MLSWGQSLYHPVCVPSVQGPEKQIYISFKPTVHTLEFLALQWTCFPIHLVYTGCILEEDEAKASWPASRLVHLYGAVCHLPKFTEVILKIFLACVPAETTNKHFPKRREETTMFSIIASITSTLNTAVEWGWCKCTHCSRTSVDPVMYGGRSHLLCLQAILQQLYWKSLPAQQAYPIYSLIRKYMLHLIPARAPIPPVRPANGANKGRLNKETWQTASAYSKCRLTKD